MKKFAIVLKQPHGGKNAGDIVQWYDADAPQKWASEWGDPEYAEHVELTSGDYQKMAAVLIAEKWTKEGESDVTVDPEDPSWTHVPEHYELQEDSDLASAIDDQNLEIAIRQTQIKCNQILMAFKKRNVAASISVADSKTLFAQPLIKMAMDALREGAIETAKAYLEDLKADSSAMSSLALISAPTIDATYIDTIISDIDSFLGV